jgi:REP element-mobilizing transposase RayT
MPNHVHGVVWLPSRANVNFRSASNVASQRPPRSLTAENGHAFPLEGHLTIESAASGPGLAHGVKARSLQAVVRAFKSSATSRINALLGQRGERLWQSGFYETVIRDERHLASVRQYILNNPAKWAEDHHNPVNWTLDPSRALPQIPKREKRGTREATTPPGL